MDDHQGQGTSNMEHEVPAQPAEAHSVGNTGEGSTDAESGMEALLRDADYAFHRLRRGETIEGTVVRIDDDEVLVDVGSKSEGIIPAREFYSEEGEAQPLHIGDRTLVYVMQPEDQEGHAVLSLRRARMERSWREVEELYHEGAIIEAPVVDFNKGGLIVDFKGIRGFVPVSQILDLRNVTRQDGESEEMGRALTAMKGRRLHLKVIEINRSRNRLILSERAAAQERRTQRKDELLDTLEAGQIRHGVVSNLTNFGAFVDLGGADGLIHVSELSYNRVNHPSEILQVGQDTDVYVLSVDRDTKKIALSLKRALPDPWTTVEERYHVGQVVPATITKLAKFGAFAKVEEGLEGLIHLSELTNLQIQDAAAVVQEGQQVEAKIIHIDSRRRRLGLSIRQAILPLDYMDTYGDFDDSMPFSQDLGDLMVAANAANSFPAPSPEDVEQTGEVDDSAESEPQLDQSPGNGTAAGVTDEESSASDDAQPNDREAAPPVASAAQQNSSE